MKAEELKNYPDGVCLGYSTLEYLYKNKPELLDSYTVKFMPDCDFMIQPKVVYPFLYVCDDKIRCRIKIKSKQGFENFGIVWRMNKNGETNNVSYVAKLNTLPLDYDIDSLYEVKNESFILPDQLD